MHFLKSSLLIISFTFFSTNVIAQFNNFSKTQFKLFSGKSPHSVIFLGKTPNATSEIVTIQFRKKLSSSFKNLPIYYQAEIIPILNYTYPKRDEGGRIDNSHGFGFSPIGYGIYKPINKKLWLSVFTNGGFILLNEKFPTDKGRRLNYTFGISAETLVSLSSTWSFSLGYKFHHISNAQTGSENPGLDSNFITLSIILSK